MSTRPAVALRWAPAWVVAVVALWPLPMATNVLLGAGALAAAGWLLLRRSSGGGALLSGPAWALTSVLFCAYWLPEVAAAPDAESGWQAWRSALLDLRFLPALWLAAAAVADTGDRRRVFAGLAVVALAWALDGLLAAALGYGPLQALYAWLAPFLGEQAPACTAGAAAPLGEAPFAACGTGFGLALACLSPFALALGARFGNGTWAALALVLIAAVVLSAAPVAWIALAVVLVSELWHRPGARRALATLAVTLAGLGLAFALVGRSGGQTHAETGPRWSNALTPVAVWNDTSAHGRAALCAVRQHPVNGVGVGGLAPAAQACPPQAQPAASDSATRLLPLWLDVLAETGALGLLLWLAGVALAWRAWRYADATARHSAWPALQALMAMLFPLNASLPAYAAPWGAALLLMAGLYAGALWGRERG